jgi:hypothetical protein
MKKKYKNIKCHEINCRECPLRMLDCRGGLQYGKTLQETFKDYVAIHSIGMRKDEELIKFIQSKLEKEKK